MTPSLAAPLVVTVDAKLNFSRGPGYYLVPFFMRDDFAVERGEVRFIPDRRHQRGRAMPEVDDIMRISTPVMRFLHTSSYRGAVRDTRNDSEKILLGMIKFFGDKEFFADEARTALVDFYQRVIADSRDMGVFLKFEMLTRPGMLAVRSAGGNRQKWRFLRDDVPTPLPLYEAGSQGESDLSVSLDVMSDAKVIP